MKDLLRLYQKTDSITQKNKVIFFRESRKQKKETVNFTINNEEYSLDRNSKIKINLPTKNETIIQISESPNSESCELVIASEFYTKYYEISLSKKNESYIKERNGNFKYLKTRFKYYEKKKIR